MKQAERADKELASGHDRGPLHGIPWGAKDLISVAGYPTTWGATQFREQQFVTDARVAQRLDEAGAVLVAKLSLGALAMGDKWFNGQTKNPWNLEQGSSGSSAGSASAVAAGLVPFAIGSETLGSIVSPGRRCGVVGLRPTFGRVSRAGCMALSWTMDKIGPMARTADDCGAVLAAIHGRDDADPTTVDRWFHWPVKADLSKLRIGRVTNCDTSPPDQAALDILKELGATIVEIELPRGIPDSPLSSMLDVEAALARALAVEDVIPQIAVAAIVNSCRADLMDADALAKSLSSAGNLAIPLVKQLTAAVASADPDAARYVHWGATSQDVIDSGRVLQLRDAIDLITTDLAELADILASLAHQHRATIMMGRTWMQHAQPTTLGLYCLLCRTCRVLVEGC